MLYVSMLCQAWLPPITSIFPDMSFDRIFFFFADPIKGQHAMLIAKSVVLEAIDQEWMNQPMQSPLYLTVWPACRSTIIASELLVIIEVIQLTKPHQILKTSQTNLFSENIIVSHMRCSTMKPVTLRMILWSNIKLINWLSIRIFQAFVKLAYNYIMNIELVFIQ